MRHANKCTQVANEPKGFCATWAAEFPKGMGVSEGARDHGALTGKSETSWSRLAPRNLSTTSPSYTQLAVAWLPRIESPFAFPARTTATRKPSLQFY
jgi:hypothetical protein